MSVKYSESSREGKIAIDFFVEFLKIKEQKFRPSTLSEQFQEIDLVVKGKNGIKTLEVKKQSFKNAIVIEDKNIGGGWIYVSKADYLIQVNKRLKRIIRVDMPALQKWYGKHKEEYRLHKDKEETVGDRGDKWYGYFRVIPIADLSEVPMIVWEA